MRALQDAGGLLTDLVESPLNDALACLAALEIGHEVGDLVDEIVDRLPVVAAHRERKRVLSDALRRVALKALLRCSLDVHFAGIGFRHDVEYAPSGGRCSIRGVPCKERSITGIT